MKQSTGERETFVVRILNTQNATWQGTVTWTDGRRTEPFRSALELIRLIDSTLLEQEEEGGCAGPGELRKRSALFQVWQTDAANPRKQNTCRGKPAERPGRKARRLKRLCRQARPAATMFHSF